MAAQVSENFTLPVEGSSYFEYLRDFPVGFSMEMDLGAMEEEQCVFVVTKVAQDQWRGCPFELGMVSTIQLFEHVVNTLEGDKDICVCHGKDPRKVKKEIIDRCALLLASDHAITFSLCVHPQALISNSMFDQPISHLVLHGGRGLEPEAPKFFSISNEIDLTGSDVEDSEADCTTKPFASYDAVHLSLTYPSDASPSAAPKAAKPEAAKPEAAAPEAAAPIAAAPEAAAPEAAAPEAAAPEAAAPIAAEIIAAEAPAEFQHVMLHYSGYPSEEGVCFFRNSKQFALAFADGTWSGCKVGTRWDPLPALQQQCDIAGSIIAPGKMLLPEGWLYGMSLIQDWHVFDKFAHMPDGSDPRCSATPRLPPLEAGHIVDCVGKVWSGDGNTCASTTTGLEFLSIAQQHDGKQWRRYAVLVLPSGELTWGELLGVTEGLIKRSEPLAQASAKRVAECKSRLPEFLAKRNVGGVNSLLARLVTGDGEPHVRRTRSAASAGASSSAPNSSPLSLLSPPAPKWPQDLKGVQITALRKLTDAQLQELCTERQVRSSV